YEGRERLERHHIAVRPLTATNITMEFVIENTHARHSGEHGMVVLRLQRTYHREGTNGTLSMAGQPICHTIELPWRNNRRNKSCIPEGRYHLRLLSSARFGMRICVEGVPDRSGILIHAANKAAAELRGCIAPVTK